MRRFRALTYAQWYGFWREKQNLFWVIAFPLMFLIIFGAIFTDQTQSRAKLTVVGSIPLIEQMQPSAKANFDDIFNVTYTTDREAALKKVRKGDIAGVVEMQQNNVVLHFSRADSVRAATVQGALQSFVQTANVALSEKPPTFTFVAEQVEDSSLKPIQFLAPGILGWAVAMSATFGAAMPLVEWRNSQLLRRLRLSPARVSEIVGSRTVVSISVAFVQMVIFIGVAIAFFGLQLTGSWWLAIPIVASATLAFMAIGLFTGAVSRTAEGASGIASFLVTGMAFLSGSFIPLEGAPGWLRVASQFMPLGHLNEGMLDVMVRGQGAGAAIVPVAVLLAFTLVFLLLAARVFRWES